VIADVAVRVPRLREAASPTDRSESDSTSPTLRKQPQVSRDLPTNGIEEPNRASLMPATKYTNREFQAEGKGDARMAGPGQAGPAASPGRLANPGP